MPSRKRQRSVAFGPDDDDTTTREVDSPFDDPPQAELEANSRVWDDFCEEYHEGIVFLFALSTTNEKKKCWSNSRLRCNAHLFLSASWMIKHSVSSPHQSALG